MIVVVVDSRSTPPPETEPLTALLSTRRTHSERSCALWNALQRSVPLAAAIGPGSLSWPLRDASSALVASRMQVAMLSWVLLVMHFWRSCS